VKLREQFEEWVAGQTLDDQAMTIANRIKVAFAQWPEKKPADHEFEAPRIVRDIRALRELVSG
jgi:hypothetical protein